MKNWATFCCFIVLFSGSGFLPASFAHESIPAKALKFPYKKAGLTERQAAAHLLGRFTFGAQPGQVEEVVKMGLEKWFGQQLQAGLPDEQVHRMLAGYETLKMTNAQIARTFPKGGQLLKQAIKDGVIDPDARQKDAASPENRKAYKQKMEAYMAQKGYRPQAGLYRELINQKILRAAYSQNQLQEILTSFWFNHFNVSLTKNDCSHFVTVYERDAIRPHVLGRFEALLLATAKSPAMLTYLDNFKSSAAAENRTPAQKARQQGLMQQLERRQATDTMMQKLQVTDKIKKAAIAQGLNENYAREIMELHTLGVDGGYTQQDVTQAARVLTGWTVMPMGGYAANLSRRTLRNRPAGNSFTKEGIVRDGDFLFAANKHDKGEKIVLGTRFPANGGYEEGVQLIKLLAHHPATARFISTKLAMRFVIDNPPKTLIDKMATTFLDQEGDIRQVLLTMVSSPEFWDKSALREKTKSPFELAISSVRGLDAQVQAPYQLYQWITKMGEKMYYYQAPTGFPDKGPYWINTGSLLNRMNFGLALASQRIPGITFNLAALNQNREPESAQAALLTYSQLLMPERNLDETIKRLTPTLQDPHFGEKVDVAARKIQPAEQVPAGTQEQEEDEMMKPATVQAGKDSTKPGGKNRGRQKPTSLERPSPTGNNAMLAQVVGIIIGSPEFQRR